MATPLTPPDLFLLHSSWFSWQQSQDRIDYHKSKVSCLFSASCFGAKQRFLCCFIRQSTSFQADLQPPLGEFFRTLRRSCKDPHRHVGAPAAISQERREHGEQQAGHLASDPVE